MGTTTALPIRGAIALALTAAGSALIIGFQPPQATLGTTPGTGSPAATGATRTPGAGAGAGTGPGAGAGSGAGGTGGSGSAGNAGSTGNTATAGPTTGGAANGTAGHYKNGNFTGSGYQDPFGVIQVAVTISGGRITDVQTIAQPGDRRSQRINTIALPMLHDQALTAQGAQIDGVSGATWTSEAYAASLQSALDQANG